MKMRIFPTLLEHCLRFHSCQLSHRLTIHSTCSSCVSELTAAETVASILTHQRSKARWSTLLLSYPTGFTPSLFSLVASHIRNNPHLVLRFFHFTTRKSLCKHDLSSYSTVIHILARSRLKTHARELICIAIRATPDDSHPTKSKQLKLFESLVRTYNQCASAPFVFDLLVKSCLDMRKVDGSMEIVRLLKSRGISPQISTCNQLIWAVSKVKGASEGYEVYKEVFCDAQEDARRSVTVTPNVQTFISLMVSFYREGSLERVEALWSEMESSGCSSNAYSYGVLMAVLCEQGRLGDAERLWEEMRVKGLQPDAVAYNTMIGGFCENGDVARAEEFVKEMGLCGIEASSVTYEHLIKGYCKLEDADSAVAVYKDMRRKVSRPVASAVEMLIRLLYFQNRVVEALQLMRGATREPEFYPTGKSYEWLIKGLCEVGNMEEALKLQAEMVGKGFEPDKLMYDAFIDGYMRLGNEKMAAALRKEVLETRGKSASSMYIPYEELVFALKSCKKALEISGLHGYMVKTGLNRDTFALSKLFAASILDTQYAASIFKHIECPNLYMYNTLLRSYSISDCPRQAFGVFNGLRSKDILLDQFSFVTTLKACSSALDVHTSQTIHGLALRTGHVSFINVKNSLLNVYAVCGRILDAQKLFDENPQPNDLVSWNILMRAYVNVSMPEEALEIFRLMKRSNTDFDITTVLHALHASGDVGYSLGVEALHGQCFRNGFSSDLNLVTAVVDMYAKVGKIDSGRQMFDSIADKDVVLWNCMIDKYAKAGLLEESLALLQSMKHAQIKPNSATLVGLISACAAFEATNIGYSVNGFIEEEGLPMNVVLGTALVDMYAKFGFLDHAISIFDRMESKDIKSWTAMISGYGAHGYARDAVSLFCLMEEEGFRPNKVTFLSVLNACSHGGLVEEGTLFLKKMVQEYGLLPEIEHYGCLIDLFGRAGLLEDAHNFIMSLPIKDDATSWRALLSACRMYGNVKLGEYVRTVLIGLEKHPTDSILLSGTYATAGSLQDQIRLQEMEDKFSRVGGKDQTMVKEAGYSKFEADSGCC